MLSFRLRGNKMLFSARQKLIAVSITHIFESFPPSPAGNPDTVAVLKDGAGISYGISQDTHASGNLARVIEFYLEESKGDGNLLYEPYFRKMLPHLKNTAFNNRMAWADNDELKRILREAGQTAEMRSAQEKNMNRRLGKAIKACEGSNFSETLSLAVAYDSINHGSWELIRDRVNLDRRQFLDNLTFERAWITRYVAERDRWLENHPKKILRATDYRTDFFLAQIARNNWNLDLPVYCHGYRLTTRDISAQEVMLISSETEVSTISDGEIDLLFDNIRPAPAAEIFPADIPSASASDGNIISNFDNKIADNSPVETSLQNTPNQESQPPPYVPQGDSADAVSRWNLKIEDLKPMVLNKLSFVWKTFGKVNFAQFPTFSGTGLVSGLASGNRYWWLGLAVGAGVAVFITLLTGCAAIIASIVLGLIWWKNRGEQIHYRTLQADSRTDPTKYNLGLEIIKKF